MLGYPGHFRGLKFRVSGAKSSATSFDLPVPRGTDCVTKLKFLYPAGDFYIHIAKYPDNIRRTNFKNQVAIVNRFVLFGGP